MFGFKRFIIITLQNIDRCARSPEMLEALLFWLDELLRTYDDVYVVSMSQVMMVV